MKYILTCRCGDWSHHKWYVPITFVRFLYTCSRYVPNTFVGFYTCAPCVLSKLGFVRLRCISEQIIAVLDRSELYCTHSYFSDFVCHLCFGKSNLFDNLLSTDWFFIVWNGVSWRPCSSHYKKSGDFRQIFLLEVALGNFRENSESNGQQKICDGYFSEIPLGKISENFLLSQISRNIFGTQYKSSINIFKRIFSQKNCWKYYSDKLFSRKSVTNSANSARVWPYENLKAKKREELRAGLDEKNLNTKLIPTVGFIWWSTTSVLLQTIGLPFMTKP